MTQRFDCHVAPESTEIRLIGPGGPISTDLWPIEASKTLLAGVDLSQRLIASGAAIAVAETLLVEHRAVSRLSAREASSLGMPPVAEVIAHIETRGLMTRPDFRALVSWRRPSGQPVVGAERIGAWLRLG